MDDHLILLFMFVLPLVALTALGSKRLSTQPSSNISVCVLALLVMIEWLLWGVIA